MASEKGKLTRHIQSQQEPFVKMLRSVVTKQNNLQMKILLTGILGGIVMFIWTSVAHMSLPLGETGIHEIPNESAVLSAMQSNIGDQTGLYIFPGPGVGNNATRQEKNEAMRHMAEKMAANPSGILHVSRARASVHDWQMARDRIRHRTARSHFGRFSFGANAHCELCWPCRFRAGGRNPGGHDDEHFLLELVRLPRCLHRQLHAHPDGRLPSCGSCCRAHLAKARFPLTRIAKVSHEVPARSVPAGPSRFHTLLQLCHRYV
jgi:hypothetical protein